MHTIGPPAWPLKSTRCVLNPGGISCSPVWKLKRDFLSELHLVSCKCDVPFQSAERVTETRFNSLRLFGWTCHIGAIQQAKKRPSWQVKRTRGTFAQTEQFIFSRDSVDSLYFTCHLVKITLSLFFPALDLLQGRFTVMSITPRYQRSRHPFFSATNTDVVVICGAILRRNLDLDFWALLTAVLWGGEVGTQADTEIESLHYLEVCRYLNVSILQSSGSPLKSCPPSLCLSLSPVLVRSRGGVTAVFSNSLWHERALGLELLMEWLIGPVTFYCGGAAEPRRSRAVTSPARVPVPPLRALAPHAHFHLRPQPGTSSPWISRSMRMTINPQWTSGAVWKHVHGTFAECAVANVRKEHRGQGSPG